MAEVGKDINKAKQLLEAGELVAIPTETVYGLAGNALNPLAVAKIFSVKKRPQFDPLIVHVAGFEHVREYATNIPVTARQLAETFWPGPLTLLLQKKPVIPDLVTSGLPAVGLRCPRHPLTSALLNTLRFPVAAPSANPFGYVSPTQARHVEDQLGKDIPYILDGGSCDVGIESTIVGFENERPVIYRLGGIAIEAIEKITGPVTVQLNASSDPKSPGQLKSHYAPSLPLIIGDLAALLQQYPAHSSGILSYNKDFNSPYQFILSPTGALEEAAQNLFRALRSFDEMPVEIILCEAVPDFGIGRAINDRLRRAAARN